jgi:hypothetical protein
MRPEAIAAGRGFSPGVSWCDSTNLLRSKIKINSIHRGFTKKGGGRHCSHLLTRAVSA